MTRLRPQAGEIPSPFPTVTSDPFWDGCQRHELLYQRCGHCGSATHTPASVCAHCSSLDLTWVPSSGRGEVYSWTTVWRPPTPAFVVPFVPIIVEMEEGWTILSNLIDCEHEAARVGLPVQVAFHAIHGGSVLAYFCPRQ